MTYDQIKDTIAMESTLPTIVRFKTSKAWKDFQKVSKDYKTAKRVAKKDPVQAIHMLQEAIDKTNACKAELNKVKDDPEAFKLFEKLALSVSFYFLGRILGGPFGSVLGVVAGSNAANKSDTYANMLRTMNEFIKHCTKLQDKLKKGICKDEDFGSATESDVIAQFSAAVQPAQEGLLQKFRNKKIPKNEWRDVKALGSVGSFKEMAKKLCETEETPEDFVYRINGVTVDIARPTNARELIADDPSIAKEIDALLSKTREVYDAVIDRIMHAWNDSKGSDGPWAWNEEEFKPVTKQRIASQVRLNLISVGITDTSRYVQWWFDDGEEELYGSHSIVVDSRDAFEGNHLKKTGDIFTLEG